MNSEPEQKLKLSASNIFALIAILISMMGGYINLSDKITTLSQKVNTNEKAIEGQSGYNGKIDFKLDKIIETINEIKVENAEQRILKSERKK